MEQKKRNTDAIRQQLLKAIYQGNGMVPVADLAETFQVTPAALYKQLTKLEQDGVICAEKEGRAKRYELVDTLTVDRTYETADLSEDTILRRDFAELLNGVTSTVRSVFSYVFTEMLNNAIEHSGSLSVDIHAYRNAYALGCFITDKGVGIFTKIQQAMGLEEKRFAILELAKGKFTTDPGSHTGEGVFFSSKVADRFYIFSDSLAFIGDNSAGDADPVLMDRLGAAQGKGTRVCFEIAMDRTVTFADVANRYTQAPDDYGFSKTIVPVRLLEYREANPVFVSRSQAKRLLVRFERFANIVLDFADVEEIGQGFADEVFRVFPSQHPNTTIAHINASPLVERMIKRAQAAG